MDIAIKTVMNLHDFAPSPDVNAAFSGLVAAAVQATTLPKWCNDEVCHEVQRRCSLSESEMEIIGRGELPAQPVRSKSWKSFGILKITASWCGVKLVCWAGRVCFCLRAAARQ